MRCHCSRLCPIAEVRSNVAELAQYRIFPEKLPVRVSRPLITSMVAAQLKWLMRLTRDRLEALSKENEPKRERLRKLEGRAGWYKLSN